MLTCCDPSLWKDKVTQKHANNKLPHQAGLFYFIVKDDSQKKNHPFPHLCEPPSVYFYLFFCSFFLFLHNRSLKCSFICVMRGLCSPTSQLYPTLCNCQWTFLADTVWSRPALTFSVTWGRVDLLRFIIFPTNYWASRFLTSFACISPKDLNFIHRPDWFFLCLPPFLMLY